MAERMRVTSFIDTASDGRPGGVPDRDSSAVARRRSIPAGLHRRTVRLQLNRLPRKGIAAQPPFVVHCLALATLPHVARVVRLPRPGQAVAVRAEREVHSHSSSPRADGAARHLLVPQAGRIPEFHRPIGARLGLSEEAGGGLGRGIGAGQDHFQGAGAVEPGLAGLVNDAHAAAAQLARDLVAGMTGAVRRLPSGGASYAPVAACESGGGPKLAAAAAGVPMSGTGRSRSPPATVAPRGSGAASRYRRQFTVACRKRDKVRQSGRPGQ